MPQQIDPQVKNLVSAIGRVETGDPSPEAYTAKGKSGEFGRYQFMPDTYKAYAQRYLGDANAQPTVENQNKIAYDFVKEKKDAGYNPAQIASMWNAGESKPDAYKQNHVGTNSQGVAFDTPSYAKRVSQYYQEASGQSGGGSIAPAAAAPTQTSGDGVGLLPNVGKIATDLGSNLSGRVTDLSQSLGKVTTGPAGLVNGLIQGAGAVAGGIGDVINSGLQLIPGVQFGEQKLGEGIQALGKTQTGQEIGGAIQQFASDHPEVSKDIGAAINIASVFPMFKAVGLAKEAAAGGVTAALKGKLETQAAEEIKNVLPTKVATSVARAESRGLNPIKALVSDSKNLPEVVERPGGGYEYSSAKAAKNINSQLDDQEANLQRLLNSGIKKNVGISIEDTRQKVLSDIANEYQLSGNYTPAVKAVNDYFDSIKASAKGRDYIDLKELNDIKRDVRSAVNFDNLTTKSSAVKYSIGQSLMDQIEKIATQNGINGVKEINQTMGQQLEALKILKGIDGKAVKAKNGLLKEGMADVAGAAGEAAGNMAGIPLAGTFAGRGIARAVLKGRPSSALSQLGRNLPSKGALRKGLVNTSLGVAGQALARPQQQ